MKLIKAFSFLALFLGFSYAANAQCTVNTPCNSYTFNVSGVSTSSSTSNGVTTTTKVQIYLPFISQN